MGLSSADVGIRTSPGTSGTCNGDEPREQPHEHRKAGSAFRVVEIRGLDEFAPLTQRWDQAVSQAAAPNVFVTSEWLQSWWAHFGAGRDLWLLLIDRDGESAVGAAPFMITSYRAGGVRLRVLELPGADIPTCGDHLEIASSAGEQQAVAELVARHLIRGSRRWDVARLEAVPEQSVTMTRLAGLLQAQGFRSEGTPSMPCPYLRLEEGPESYDQHLQRRFRDLKKYLSAVERANGRFLLVRTEVELQRILADLRRLNLLRVNSKGGIPSLSRDDFFAFVQDVCARFLRRGWLRLHALEVNGEVIATNLNFAYGEKVYGYMSGLDPAWTKHGIGTVLMRHAIRFAMQEGFKEYDFLRGGEDYKYRWTSSQRSLATVNIVNHPLRYLAFKGGSLTNRALSALRDVTSQRPGQTAGVHQD